MSKLLYNFATDNRKKKIKLRAMEKKSCTDVNQGKQLSAFLPLESADCFWDYDDLQKFHRINWFEDGYNKHSQLMLNENNVCAWSLSALLNFLPDELTDSDGYVYRNAFFHLKGKYIIQYPKLSTLWPSLFSVESDNPVDAVFEMIVKLHEQNLL